MKLTAPRRGVGRALPFGVLPSADGQGCVATRLRQDDDTRTSRRRPHQHQSVRPEQPQRIAAGVPRQRPQGHVAAGHPDVWPAPVRSEPGEKDCNVERLRAPCDLDDSLQPVETDWLGGRGGRSEGAQGEVEVRREHGRATGGEDNRLLPTGVAASRPPAEVWGNWGEKGKPRCAKARPAQVQGRRWGESCPAVGKADPERAGGGAAA